MNTMLRSIPESFFSRKHRLVATVAVVVFVAGAFLFLQPSLVGAFSGCTAEAVPPVNADFEARVVELVNQERARNGNLPPLKLVSSLTAAARYHAADMGQDDYFSHESKDRAGDGYVKACGTFDRINLWYKGWMGAGENIAAGYNSPEAVMQAWMKSDGHRGNILNNSYAEIGVGYFSGAGKFPSYWVQDFGVRSDVAPMVLAGEAPVTTDRNIDVYVHGEWNEIRLKNDNGAWTDWQPFTNSFDWTINKGRGQHVVAAELRNAGTMRSTCDTITLDVPAVAAEKIDAPIKVFMPDVRNSLIINCD
jgi:uncharacterized protein YkwD